MAKASAGEPGKARKTSPEAKATKGAAKGAGRKSKAARAAEEAQRRRAEARLWTLAAVAMTLAVLALRIAVIAADLVPPHFDEAQYWAYGQELAWGYFSKPPGVGAAIRLTTAIFGDTSLGLRLASPLSHAVIAWTIFLIAGRIADARTGFWAAAAYTAAPGVSVSAMIVSTDPVMMVGWAIALYAMLRAGEAGGARWWWAVVGAAVGLGFLAKYTALAFAAAALAYGLFSARGRDWTGTAIALGVGLVVALPNLLWNLENGFATVAHVAEDADPGEGYGNPLALAEFLGAQLGVIGPVLFAAILAALINRNIWREQPGMRLIAWQTVGLLLPITALALATRAQPNWAAPAYVAGAILGTHWLMVTGRMRLLIYGQIGLGAVAFAVVLGLAAFYEGRSGELPRATDPFKKTRIGPPFCERALAAMGEEGAAALLSDSRRRLSECMLLGGLGWDGIAVWNPDLVPDSHHELVATLQPGDDRRMVLALLGHGRAEEIAARFAEALPVDSGVFSTHRDRQYPYEIWVVQGFAGYGTDY